MEENLYFTIGECDNLARMLMNKDTEHLALNIISTFGKMLPPDYVKEIMPTIYDKHLCWSPFVHVTDKFTGYVKLLNDILGKYARCDWRPSVTHSKWWDKYTAQ